MSFCLSSSFLLSCAATHLGGVAGCGDRSGCWAVLDEGRRVAQAGVLVSLDQRGHRCERRHVAIQITQRISLPICQPARTRNTKGKEGRERGGGGAQKHQFQFWNPLLSLRRCRRRLLLLCFLFFVFLLTDRLQLIGKCSTRALWHTQSTWQSASAVLCRTRNSPGGTETKRRRKKRRRRTKRLRRRKEKKRKERKRIKKRKRLFFYTFPSLFLSFFVSFFLSFCISPLCLRPPPAPGTHRQPRRRASAASPQPDGPAGRGRTAGPPPLPRAARPPARLRQQVLFGPQG